EQAQSVNRGEHRPGRPRREQEVLRDRRPSASSRSAGKGKWCIIRSQERPMATANRLIHETSPYLRQHAHNPVDWYPWGPEALAKARAENRPIFLSIGYAACHWCHV